MKFYIFAIEQTKIDETLNEYANTEKVADETVALSKYYKKLSDVSADIGKNHTYMDIRIVNSFGVEVKRDTIGNYEA